MKIVQFTIIIVSCVYVVDFPIVNSNKKCFFLLFLVFLVFFSFLVSEEERRV